jgi:uncharacterized membrane protein YdjX (TVP38/TMEM64 family)
MIPLRPRYKAAILLAILLLGAGSMLAWAGPDLIHPAALRVRLGALFTGLGPWAPLVYVLVYWVSPFLLLPAIPMSLVAGALFGPVWGTVWNLVGATGGACLSFFLGRALGADYVSRHAHGSLATLKKGIEDEGWRFVAFIRLVPILPFGIANVLMGATEIRFWTYAITTLIAMAPGAAVYAWIGWAGRSAAGGAEHLVAKAGIAIGLLLLLSGIPTILRMRRAAKAKV